MTDGKPWQVTSLDSHKDYKNRLWQFTEQCLPQSWKMISTNVMNTCASHPKAIQSCLDELTYWIKALYSGQQIDYNAFIEFLINRANESEFYHARRLNQLL